VKHLPRNDPNKPLTSLRAEKEAKEAVVEDDDLCFVFDAADLRANIAKIQKGETAVDLQPLRQPKAPEHKAGPPPPPAVAAPAPPPVSATPTPSPAPAPAPPPPNHQRHNSVGSRFIVEGDGHSAPEKTAAPPPPPVVRKETSPQREGTSRFIVVDPENKTPRGPPASPVAHTIVTPTGHVFTTTEK